MPEEALDPAGVGLASDQRAGAVPEGVEAEHPKAGGRRSALEAAAQRRAVQWPAESRAEHVVARAEELASLGEASEGLGRRIGDR